MGRVLFLLQGGGFPLQVLDQPLHVFHHGGLAVAGQGHPGAGRVEHADGLVGQLAAADVAARQFHRLHHGGIEDAHLVVGLHGVGDAAHHLDRRVLGGFLDLHQLEAARQGGVLLEVFLVFRPGGGGDGAQLAPGQGRLEQVGRIVLASLTAGADQGVGFVDEQDDGLQAGLDLVHHRAQAVLELALDAGAGLEQAQVQGAQVDIAQHFRHVVLDDAQGQALHHGGLAHPGFPGEDGVVLAAAHEDVDHLPDFPVPAQDRVDLAGPGQAGQVYRVFVQVGAGTFGLGR